MNTKLSTVACPPLKVHLLTVRISMMCELTQAGVSSTSASGKVFPIIGPWVFLLLPRESSESEAATLNTPVEVELALS